MANKIQKQLIDLEGELKPGDGIQIDKDTKYEYGSQLETEGVPLIDPGGGPVNVIRVFHFKMNPEKKDFQDHQDIFSAHAKQIETILWGDGLRPLESTNPRVILDSEKRIYQIFVPCEAAKGVIFSHEHRNPELLHKQLAKGKLDSCKR